jgi:carbamoyltransferase
VCLVEDGLLRFALGLERTARVKRGTVPLHVYPAAMASLTSDILSAAGLVSADVDGWIATSTESRDDEDEAKLTSVLGLVAPPERCLALPHPGHHLAHASAAFYTSGFSEAVALIIDAYGSIVAGGRERETAFSFRAGAKPEVLLRVIRDGDRTSGYPRDGRIWAPAGLSGIGEIYRVVTLALGFREAGTMYDDAGKTMGLAPFGKRLSAENLFYDLAPDGEVRSDCAAEALVELGVAVREGDELCLIPRPPHAPLDQFHRDLAAQVQDEFEEAVLHVARHVLALSGSRSLVACGGSFLNSCLNTRLLRETEIDRLFVFPAATDDGNAVGAALYAYHNLLGQPSAPGPVLREVYLGPPRLTGVDIRDIVERWGLQARQHPTSRDAVAAAAAAISRGEIIGWYQDRSEFGPRSLGARSILCHPGIPGMKNRLNSRVKFREAFRPFAGSVLAERAHKWFDMPAAESPFMLLVCPVRPDQQHLISEIVHVDGTCRVQTVHEGMPGSFRALIEEFEVETGLPVVLNTSFNLRGMPIVERPDDAMDCLYGSRLDRLFIGDIEVAAPDLSALCPERAQHSSSRSERERGGGQRAAAVSGDSQRLLELAEGTRSIRDLALEVGADPEQLVDLALELRRHGLLHWAGRPRAVSPSYPLQQYHPDSSLT